MLFRSINEMHKSGHDYMEKYKAGGGMPAHSYAAALLTRVNRVEDIVNIRNEEVKEASEAKASFLMNMNYVRQYEPQDILADLKFGKPAAFQKKLDQCISILSDRDHNTSCEENTEDCAVRNIVEQLRGADMNKVKNVVAELRMESEYDGDIQFLREGGIVHLFDDMKKGTSLDYQWRVDQCENILACEFRPSMGDVDLPPVGGAEILSEKILKYFFDGLIR